MRVVATEDFKTYYQMVCINVAKGEEFDGPFAEFLYTGGCPVDVLDETHTTQDDPGGGEQQPSGDLDIAGTAAQVLEWVGDDPDRARTALEAETEKEKPRSTLVKRLEEIAA